VGVLFLVFCGGALLLRGALQLRLARLFSPDAVMGMVSRQLREISRKLFWLASTFGRMKVGFERFQGPPLPRTFMIISNHQSLADIAAVGAAFPSHGIRFVAKRELGRWVPYVSLNLRAGQHAVISRTSDFRHGHRALAKLADLAGRGYCPVIFPEGRRSRTGDVQPFQAGGARIILERAPLPVLSVAVNGGYRISGLRDLLSNMGSTFYRLKPLTLYPAPRNKAEILDILSRTHDEICRQVLSWQEEDRRGQKKTHP